MSKQIVTFGEDDSVGKKMLREALAEFKRREMAHLEPPAGDLLVGAPAIRAYLIALGMPKTVDPYYLRRTGQWPIGNTGGDGKGGGKLMASKRRLNDYINTVTRGDDK